MADKSFCQDCVNREESGYNLSHRQKALASVPADAADGDMIEVTFQIDTTCNAACAMCNPGFSSLWQKQINPAYKLVDFTPVYNNLLSFIDLSKTTTLRFIGGEPFATNQHVNVLRSVPNLENVNIYYVTNGSILPDEETIALWSKAKSVNIVFSIDAIDEQFHYIRWPLTWDKVKNNIDEFSKLDCVTKIKFNVTINPMNILSFPQLESWHNEAALASPKFDPLDLSTCYGIWGTDATPQTVRDQAYTQHADSHKLIRLLDTLPESDPSKWERLVKNMESLDQTRDLSWRDTFPEVAKLV